MSRVIVHIYALGEDGWFVLMYRPTDRYMDTQFGVESG